MTSKATHPSVATSSMPYDALHGFTDALQPARKAWVLAAGSALASSGLSVAVATPVLLVSRMGDGVQQQVLAERIGVHPAALVRSLDQAERAGLLERRVVPGNRRARTIHLLPEGQRLASVMETEVAALRAQLLGDIPPADLEAATRVLRELEARALRHAQSA